jgi:hypothetical protein
VAQVLAGQLLEVTVGGGLPEDLDIEAALAVGSVDQLDDRLDVVAA